jgi:hypothetical protein
MEGATSDLPGNIRLPEEDEGGAVPNAEAVSLVALICIIAGPSLAIGNNSPCP